MKRYAELVADARGRIREVMPWDLRDRLAQASSPLLVDVREPVEFAQGHIAGSINVPRGVIEAACEWDSDETVPQLAGGRARSIVLICRSGNRSALVADVLQTLGFADVVSLRTGLRGWNDFEQPIVDPHARAVDADTMEQRLTPPLRADQRRPS